MTEFERLQGQVDAILRTQADHGARLSATEATREAQERAISKFWNTDWPAIQERVRLAESSGQDRLEALERLVEAKFEAAQALTTQKVGELTKLLDKLDAASVGEWKALDIRLRAVEGRQQNLLGRVTVVAFLGAAVATSVIGLLFKWLG